MKTQPSARPTRKVMAGAAGGMAGVPAAFVIKAVWDHLLFPQEPMPTDVAIALGGVVSTLCAFLFAYMTKESA